MKRGAALIVLLLASAVTGHGDSSWRRETVDPARFELLSIFGPWQSRSLSPAGQAFAVFSANTVKLVEIRDPKNSRGLAGHAAPIHDSGWSRDGRVFATCGYDGTTRVWETVSGKTLSVLSGHAGYACSVAVSSDGKIVATGGSEDNMVKFFEASSGREHRSVTTTGGATYAMAFSGDGRFLFTSHEDNSVRVIRAADGTEVRNVPPGGPQNPPGPVGYPTGWGISRDGRYLVHPTHDGALILRETADWREVRLFEGHPGGTAHVTFHPAGRYLASSGKDGVLRLWEVETGKSVNKIMAELGQDSRLAFTADGLSLIAIGADYKVRVFGKKK